MNDFLSHTEQRKGVSNFSGPLLGFEEAGSQGNYM